MELRSKVRFIVDRDYLYKFQVEKKEFDAFVKLLLRTYTGIFSDYVVIDEQRLSTTAGVDIEIIKKYLFTLNKMRVINYFPAKKNPLIIYTEERLPQESLYITKETYHYRKERYIKRVEAMMQYCTNTSKCRSQQLIEYFGQGNSSRCGTCDVCKSRNNLELSRLEFDQVLEKIKKLLSEKSYLPNDLVSLLPYEEEHILKVVNYMLEKEKIIYTEGAKLKWHK